MKKIISCAVLLLTQSIAFADDVCQKNGYNICNDAKSIADNIARNLPMQVNANTTIDRVTRFDNEITLHGFMSFDNKALLTYAKTNNTTISQIKETMRAASISALCLPTDAMYKFITKGGKLVYSYRFSDLTPFHQVEIDHCPPAKP